MVKFFVELLGDTLLVAFAALSLHIFIRISLHGEIYLLEEIAWIRNTEMVLAGLMVLFGLERFVDDMKRHLSKYHRRK